MKVTTNYHVFFKGQVVPHWIIKNEDQPRQELIFGRACEAFQRGKEVHVYPIFPLISRDNLMYVVSKNPKSALRAFRGDLEPAFRSAGTPTILHLRPRWIHMMSRKDLLIAFAAGIVTALTAMTLMSWATLSKPKNLAECKVEALKAARDSYRQYNLTIACMEVKGYRLEPDGDPEEEGSWERRRPWD